MLYLDYAKPLADGKYILSFFADSAADLESISHGQKFITKNGTDYGVPQAGSTVIVTSPNSGKTTYVMDADGVWVVTEDISYSAVVANPSDAATAKLEKLKVNNTTYANWTETEIKNIAAQAGGGKLYLHKIYAGISSSTGVTIDVYLISSSSTPLTIETITAKDCKGLINGTINDERKLQIFPIVEVTPNGGQWNVKYVGDGFSNVQATYQITATSVGAFDTVTEL